MNFKDEFKIIYKKRKINGKQKKSPIFFLDRDGVIIEDVNYINDYKKVKLCPGAKDFIRKIYKKNIPIVIVTNQSGIKKGLISWEQYLLVTNSMIEKLGKPNPIAAIYANSHLSELPKSNWRKPNPNMILQAIKDLNLDIRHSFLIGDRESDILAGLRAGIENLIHVETGHGKNEKQKIKEIFYTENLIQKNNKNQKIFYIKNLLEFPFIL